MKSKVEQVGSCRNSQEKRQTDSAHPLVPTRLQSDFGIDAGPKLASPKISPSPKKSHFGEIRIISKNRDPAVTKVAALVRMECEVVQLAPHQMAPPTKWSTSM